MKNFINGITRSHSMKHAALIMPTLLAAPALAVDTLWLGSSGAWTDAAKWSAGVPTAQTPAVFDVLGLSTVAMPGDGTTSPAQRLIVKRGIVGLNGAGALDLSWNSAFSAGLVVGETPGTLARCAFYSTSGAQLIQCSSVDVGTGSQTQGELLVRTLAALECDGAVRAGILGSGWIQHDASTVLRAGSLELGVLSSGSGSLSGLASSSGTQPPSGVLDIVGNLTVGKSGNGNAWIGAGSSCGSLMIGQNAASNGTAWISGLRVNGAAWFGNQGVGAATVTGALDVRGPLSVALRGPDAGQPTLPASRGTLDIAGGAVRASGAVVLGSYGIGTTTISGGGSIESTASITRGADDAITIRLPAVPASAPALAAPTMTLNPGGASVTLEVVGTPEPNATWLVSRSWDAAPPVCTVVGNPGKGREFRLIPCGGDLYLATAAVGASDPDVCPVVAQPTFVPDEIGVVERGFSNGGVAVGDGFVAIGCPGPGGGVDVYRAVNGAWYYQTTLVAPDGRQVGLAVAASGTRIASRTVDATSVVVFNCGGVDWAVEQVIDTPSFTGTQSRRNTLALDGDTLAVGEPNATVGSGTVIGRVDLFRRSETVWVSEAALLPTLPASNGQVGRFVSLSGDRLAVGGLNSWVSMFERTGSTWTEGAVVPSASLPTAAALSGSTVAVVSSIPLTAWEPGAGGTWVETLNAQQASRVAMSADRIVYSGTSLVRTMERTGGQWRMGNAYPVTQDIVSLADGSDVIVALHATGFSVIGELPDTTCTADLTGDGLVNGADLGLLLGAWELTALGDLNGDGITDGADLGLMLTAFGPCAP
jgi:hypothetical protein